MPRIASTELILLKTLSREQREQLTDALYAVHQHIFAGVERPLFVRFVMESKAEHTWIQVHRNEEGAIVGYFALHIFERMLGGKLTAVFRAQAGSLRAYRGGNITMRCALGLALRYLLRHPGRPAFYWGPVIHPSSYALFAKYFGEVWPRRGAEIPPELLAFMGELAGEFRMAQVDPARPLVRQTGWRTYDTEAEREYWRQCEKPEARYFLEVNPTYTEGHGLVMMVPLTASNVAHVIRTVVAHKLRQPLAALRTLSRRLPGSARLLRSEVVRQLRSVPLFAHFDTEALKEVASKAELLTLRAGKHVFRKGDSSDELYLLARGAAYVLVEEGGQERVVDELGSGAVFGELAMLAGERRSASIRTASASTLVRIPREVLQPLLEANTELRQGVWKTFAQRRFEDLVREQARAGRKDRLTRLQQGEHLELAARDSLAVEAGATLLVLSGTVELERSGVWMATRGSMLLEARQPLLVVAREPVRLMVLPGKVPVEPQPEPRAAA
ncbi:MAG TPA: cyclic nucleotide-binding domain-containing protein [Myxococcaceae bacterium]|jgi:CRP-like cAMP-binding protein